MIKNFKFDLQRFDSAFSGGRGTQSDPYQISSQADLEQLARDVNGGDFGGNNSYSGKYFKLTKDIALTGELPTIGARREISFKGKFDGDGHTISNLTINRTEGFSYASGLFGYIDSARISNLHLTNVNINSNSANVGALVGDTSGYAGNDTYITNCSVQGTVSGTGDVGGLVGNNYGFISNCAFIGTIKKRSINTGVIAGDNALSGFLSNNYYCSKLEDGVKVNGATRIFNVNLPEGVTANPTITFGGKKYLKGGEVTFNYDGYNYKYNVNDDVTVTFKDNKFYANDTAIGNLFPDNLEGDGSENNPFLIKSVENLRSLATYVNNGNDCAGMNFKLDRDLTLKDEWAPIGTDKNKFKGKFDGNGYTISGLKINNDQSNQGLFGYVEAATIKNVNLTNVSISAKDNIGALVGKANNNTQILNCSVQGTVSGTGSIGGLVGYNSDSTVKNSMLIDGSIDSTNTANKGAIVGNNTGTLNDNYYYGTLAEGINDNGATQAFNVNVPKGVTSNSIVTFGGKNYIKSGEVTFNYNDSTYTYNVSGDVTLSLKDNKFYVNDTALGAVFPGTLEGDGSENNPFLIKSEEDLRQLATYVNKGNNCAGINFKLANDINLTGGWNPIGTYSHKFKGTFDGNGHTISNLTVDSSHDIQGLFGYVEEATIKNVNLTNFNSVNGQRVGALVGDANDNTQILNCSAQGNIKSNKFCAFLGGVVGYINRDVTIDGCSFSGNIEGFKVPKEFILCGSHVGGIVGFYNSSVVKNCAYLGGDIMSSDGGAIVSDSRDSKMFIDNYYCGKLAEGVKDNGATQIFNVNLPDNVTSNSIVTFGGKNYIKSGEVTFNYNGSSYKYNVSDDVTVTLQDNKLYVGSEELNSSPQLTVVENENPGSKSSVNWVTLSNSAQIHINKANKQGIKLYASDNGSTLESGAGNDSLWGGAGCDTFIHNGGDDVIFGFGEGDSLKTNGFNDLIATYDAADKQIKIPCSVGSVTLKDFTTSTFNIDSNIYTISGSTLKKQ